ncbi:MAG: hypothetical protein J5944_00960, partial [Lentisphaeria bacterium]|nr:hypothetical protein [Lentisphaeria bacterium]
MKPQTTTQRALAIRKTTAARKRQKGFAMEWIIIVLLVAAALVPVVMMISNMLRSKGNTIVEAGTSTNVAEAQAAVSNDTARNTQLQGGMQAANAAAEGLTGDFGGGAGG